MITIITDLILYHCQSSK